LLFSQYPVDAFFDHSGSAAMDSNRFAWCCLVWALLKARLR
jgi:hypothetical protein